MLFWRLYKSLSFIESISKHKLFGKFYSTKFKCAPTLSPWLVQPQNDNPFSFPLEIVLITHEYRQTKLNWTIKLYHHRPRLPTPWVFDFPSRLPISQPPAGVFHCWLPRRWAFNPVKYTHKHENIKTSPLLWPRTSAIESDFECFFFCRPKTWQNRFQRTEPRPERAQSWSNIVAGRLCSEISICHNNSRSYRGPGLSHFTTITASPVLAGVGHKSWQAQIDSNLAPKPTNKCIVTPRVGTGKEC